MRIAIDVRSLLEGRPGGVATYTRKIIENMVQVSPNHEYQVFYNAARERPKLVLPSEVRVRGLKYANKFFQASQALARWPRWDSYLEADCFFAPSWGLVPLKADSPLVATIHDLSFELFPEFYSWHRRRWHSLMQPRRLVQQAERLIAVSQATKRDLIDLYGVAPEKIVVIYSGVEEGELVSEEEVRSKYKLPEEFVLFLGTLEPRKNVPGIVKAFEAIAGRVKQDLVLAGAEGWLMRELKKVVKGSHNRERIRVIGAVDKQDKRAIMRAADLFVYPSFYEGFGFPPLEALLAGTPVVVAGSASLPEVVGEWGVMVEPADVAMLAGVLEELLVQPRVVPEATKQVIREKYSWQKAAQETLRVIESAV
jgi:glycosyltransferase involved in cell wall biosynthesis